MGVVQLFKIVQNCNAGRLLKDLSACVPSVRSEVGVVGQVRDDIRHGVPHDSPHLHSTKLCREMVAHVSLVFEVRPKGVRSS